MSTKTDNTNYLLREIGRLALKVLIIICVAASICSFLLVPYRVPSNNMYPMIKNGDLCFIYRHDKIFTNDVVLYKKRGEIALGRIVAINGQKIAFHDYGFTVNGYQPSEEIFYPTYPTNESDYDKEQTVPSNCYYIMNDYRENKSDSRTFGFVEKDEVIGKLIFVLRRRTF